MRGWFGLVSLVLALSLVGVLVRKQLVSTSAPVPVLQAPAAVDAVTPTPQPEGNAARQSQQIQQQYRQALEGALQPARPLPDEK